MVFGICSLTIVKFKRKSNDSKRSAILSDSHHFLVYGIDKWKAKQGSWRISEATLLMLAVIGGSIGALLGMKIWHHKTMHKGGVRDVDNIVEGTSSSMAFR